MFKEIRYQLLGKGDPNDEHDEANDLDSLTPRERVRRHVAGTLCIGLGVYIIWRTMLIVAWVFTSQPVMLGRVKWPEVRYLFAL